MDEISSPQELALKIGESIRRLRLQKNLTQAALAAQAGVSMTALRHLESGKGANLLTLIRSVRALDNQDWLRTLAPRVSLNPLHMTSTRKTRQRARPKRDHGDKA